MNKVLNDDCFNVFASIPDNSIDAIITDPPYGVLKGHKIETNVDIQRLASECFRVLKQDSPMVFFGLMPKSLNWLNVFMEKFNFRSEVIWCKRASASFMLPIPRIHESIYIYSKGKIRWNKIKGVYEDIKNSMAMDNLLNEKSLDIHENAIKSGKQTINSNQIRNDAYYKSDVYKFISDRAPEEVKFNSVWSFAQHNNINRNLDDNNITHPTVKPLLLMDRLIELTTFEGQTILDPFAGSGSTLLSARRLKRNYIGIEIDIDYYNIIQHRLAQPYQEGLFT